MKTNLNSELFYSKELELERNVIYKHFNASVKKCAYSRWQSNEWGTMMMDVISCVDRLRRKRL